jgi:hypothetical protein
VHFPYGEPNPASLVLIGGRRRLLRELVDMGWPRVRKVHGTYRQGRPEGLDHVLTMYTTRGGERHWMMCSCGWRTDAETNDGTDRDIRAVVQRLVDRGTLHRDTEISAGRTRHVDGKTE